jgi:nitrogen fixation protein NifZ
MQPPRTPVYQWGQIVRSTADLVNDGSFPDHPADALLVPCGTMGEIVNIGHHAESNTPVYLVEFNGRLVIGCLEEELAAA